jgi:cell wall-associated NlpC family hydrolase
MLFSSKGRGVDHIAIYAGNNRMIHSSAGAGGVVYDDLSTPRGTWYLARHVASRRVL